jgi:hypothetical protein
MVSCSSQVSAGLVVPIRPFLVEHGAFASEHVRAITAAFEDCLQALGVTKQSDPVALALAKQIVQLAKRGERNPTRLRDEALKSIKDGSAAWN